MKTSKVPKIVFTVEKTSDGFSAFGQCKEATIATVGDDFEHLKRMIVEATNLAKDNEAFEITEQDIVLNLDLAQFFQLYKEINAKALAERAGINRSLLSQYVSGTKKPSPKQVSKILESVRRLGREMANMDFRI